MQDQNNDPYRLLYVQDQNIDQYCHFISYSLGIFSGPRLCDCDIVMNITLPVSSPDKGYQLSSVTTSLILVIAAIFLSRSWREIRSRSRAGETKSSNGTRGKPLPGPRGIPVFGNMLSLGRTDPHLSLMKLAEVYGNIFKIQLGSRPVLVLNGLDAIQKALVKQPLIFAGRPNLFTFDLLHSLNAYGPSMSFSTHSERWKLHRKLAETSLRHFTAGSQVQFLKTVVCSEAQELAQHLTTPKSLPNGSSSSAVSPGDMRSLIRLSVSNIMCWYMFSKRHNYDDKRMMKMLELTDRFTKATGNGNPVDFLPWLRFILTKTTNEFVDFSKQFQVLVGDMIVTHFQEYKPGSERDILDYLQTSSRKYSDEELQRLGLTPMNLQQTAFDFFGAGFETVSSTLEWCILYMVAHPSVQEEVQREIDNLVGRDRMPTLDDQVKLPLTQSCLLEIQRHATPVPFAIPHSTTDDTVLEGFFIPKDIVVFVNLHSAHHDTDVWQAPEVFDPRRFLTAEGKIDEDMRNCVIPFSVGRRRCVGSELARINLFLYFTTLMHQVKFSPLPGKEVSLDAIYGLAKRPKEFNVKIERR